MKHVASIIIMAFVMLLSVSAYAGMVAITIGQDAEGAQEMHKKAGAVTSQAIPIRDKNYNKAVSSKYKDAGGTYLVTDEIARGEKVVSKQAIVSLSGVDDLKGLATWFNKQANYQVTGDNQWTTVVESDTVMIYYAPTEGYGEGIIIEKLRYK
ncbi:MAG: hypothetical protein K5633_03180 [Paludibacteraceae bacterium]|nr:hypothetical protein [Paludibacteraceae bacterium]